jgi:hypothetical protein
MQRIKLSQKRRSTYTHLQLVAWVDDDDYARLEPYTWYAVKRRHTFYAQTSPRDGTRVYLHRMIAGPDAPEVDHCNGNGLDNRREDLRPATRQQNSFNMKHRVRNVTSAFRGVYWSKDKQGWVAQIKVNYKTTCLGTFSTDAAAVLAYDAAARERFGAYARLNFPFGVEDKEFCRRGALWTVEPMKS